MTDPDDTQPPRAKLTIRRARLDTIHLYELTEEELGILERGSPASLQLNLALVFLTSGLSLLVTLLTATFPSERLFSVFVLSTIAFSALGVVLLSFWWRNRGDVERVLARVRGRLASGSVQHVDLPRSARQQPTPPRDLGREP